MGEGLVQSPWYLQWVHLLDFDGGRICSLSVLVCFHEPVLRLFFANDGSDGAIALLARLECAGSPCSPCFVGTVFLGV